MVTQGDLWKGSPVMPVGTREVSRDRFLQEQSMSAHYRNWSYGQNTATKCKMFAETQAVAHRLSTTCARATQGVTEPCQAGSQTGCVLTAPAER